jgi:hypothetical protein
LAQGGYYSRGLELVVWDKVCRSELKPLGGVNSQVDQNESDHRI